MEATIEKIYDNTKDGMPNYSIDTTEGKRLYYRGTPLYPIPNSGDTIKYEIVSTKTSANGNSYTNIKNLDIASNGDAQTAPVQTNAPISNGINKSETQRLDIFVTGVVGRSMGSGHFSVHDIGELTRNAVSAFNENLKKL